MGQQTFTDPDEGCMAAFADCMDNYDVGEADAEWPNNLLSRRTIRLASGLIGTEDLSHTVDSDEYDLCRSLATEANDIMEDVEVGMGSDSGDCFSEFFIVASVGSAPADDIDEAFIRASFGGSVFPPATISVEPLSADGEWWHEVTEYFCESSHEEKAEELAPWHRLIKWFKDHPELHSPVFVRIGDSDHLEDVDEDDYPAGTEMTGCVFPRMAIALTGAGSVVGLFGHCVIS